MFSNFLKTPSLWKAPSFKGKTAEKETAGLVQTPGSYLRWQTCPCRHSRTPGRSYLSKTTRIRVRFEWGNPRVSAVTKFSSTFFVYCGKNNSIWTKIFVKITSLRSHGQRGHGVGKVFACNRISSRKQKPSRNCYCLFIR